MHSLDLRNVNWEAPSEQNIVDLCYARMWSLSEAVALMVRSDYILSPWFIDDIRTNFLEYTKMNRNRFDALIDEGTTLLEKWGIPEVFVVEPEQGFGTPPESEDEPVQARVFTYEDVFSEAEEGEWSENSVILSTLETLYWGYQKRTGSLDETFYNLVKPGRKNGAHKK